MVDKRIGEILAALDKTKLAANTTYTPDFIVLGADGDVIAEETKGFWEDDARAKIKIAASLYPWITFRAFMPHRTGWRIETFNAVEMPHP